MVEGLRKYVERHNDIPAPADILNIIDPLPPRFKPSWAVYVAYKKKSYQGGYLLDSERDYLDKCDNFAKHGNPDEVEDYRQAQSDLIKHRLEYDSGD